MHSKKNDLLFRNKNGSSLIMEAGNRKEPVVKE